ncbi:amino acid ABC transporter ATP-binding protein [Paraburkholderia silvatlantica]|uniref:Amino acid ABC transporter ATP-binding protein (PAAT family) n=1 Tax=Paraburkholderia silvatlantica TaxID=321895 RepID=A0A2U1A6K7_9BURK|nr:amino acid ABC transporter ATP-binding protein [Paraburkholderia silvatlantica]MBB2927981.1 polar amino acid transport system ATP-binding protein [Paraburkholderia silvatlantica]PVY27457.1 amino acid ABC transporter ATP-binding protein (PAAT family) [Paraburkholderia silvatlantica]PXW34430.1 amino acid ABC transporter ATP-binding protein (PAAT family) [Paraburkholderia silvatlantica]PYE15719.1 amino acid ABC transporter ATP-binding protein (PAAT family) [Paraburkholderia silvatlantica]TDQ89
MPQLEIVDLKASYGSQTVLEKINLRVEKGEIVSLIGPSGSGKSTLLRVLMGLLPPEAGAVRLNDKVVDYASKAAVRALRSDIAIVFQQYNLFQNMTVMDNVTITPARIKGWPRAEVERDAKRLLERVGLGHRLKAYPDELSGGQQQRVAIARALALKPKVLFLDEVTAALDPELVNEVLDTIRELASDGITMFIVSHEMSFVREVSSKVVFMAGGHVVETGTPQQIFDTPQETRTREFVGKILRH